MNFKTIISAHDLAKNLNTSNWLILDCRNQFVDIQLNNNNFENSHIPNAHDCFIHDGNNSDSSSHDSSNLKTETHPVFLELINSRFNLRTQIIIYDETDSTYTNQIWLYLRSIGLENTAVLQGGLKGWIEQKYPLINNNEQEWDESNNNEFNKLINYDTHNINRSLMN